MAKSKNTSEEVIKIRVDAKSAEKELKKLSEAIGSNKKAVVSNEASVKTLAKENKGLAKAAKAGSDAQNTSAKAMNANTAKVKELKTSTKNLKEQTKDLAKQQKNGKKAAGDQAASMVSLGGSFSGVQGAIQTMGGGLKAVFTMMKTNPILFLVGLLVSLVVAFSKTKTGMEFFRKAGAVMGAVMGNLMDIIEKIGGKLISAFEDPQKTFKDFKKSIVENVTYYFTDFIPNAVKKLVGGLGLLWDALVDWDIDKAKEGLAQMVDATTDLIPGTALMKKAADIIKNDLVPAAKELAAETLKDADAAWELEKAMIANEKALADNEVAIKKTIAKQGELKEIRDDETKSYAERIQASKDLGDIEEKQAAETARLLKQKYNLILAQNALTESTEADEQKARDAQMAYLDAENASTNVRRENTKKVNALEKREAKEKEALAKNLLSLEEGNIAKARELREDDADRKISALLDEAEYNKTTLKQKIKGITDYYRVAGEVASDARSDEKAALDKEREDILNNDKITQEERDALLEENRLAQLDSLAAFKDAELEIEKEKEAALLEVKQGALDKAGQYLQMAADTTRNIHDIQNNLVEARYGKMYAALEKQRKNGFISEEIYAKKKASLDKKKAAEKYKLDIQAFINKAISAAQAVVNTAAAVLKALRDGGLPLAIAVGAVGATQLGVILTAPPPPPPTFEKGGDASRGIRVGGRRHSQGGTKYRGEDGNTFEVEEGEGIFVTKRSATDEALRAVDSINTWHGGHSMFAEGHRLLAEGGQVGSGVPGLTPDQVRGIVSETVSATLANTSIEVQVADVQAGLVAREGSLEAGAV